MQKDTEFVLVRNKSGNVIEAPYVIAKPMIERGELVMLAQEDNVAETKQPKRGRKEATVTETE